MQKRTPERNLRSGVRGALFGTLCQGILRAFFHQENGKQFGQSGEQRDLILRPDAGGGALIKADETAETAVIPDGALEGGFGAEGGKHIVLLGRKGADIGGVENTEL